MGFWVTREMATGEKKRAFEERDPPSLLQTNVETSVGAPEHDPRALEGAVRDEQAGARHSLPAALTVHRRGALSPENERH